MNIETYFRLVYTDIFIPIYIYEDEKLVCTYPEEALNFPLPSEYLSNFSNMNISAAFFQTDSITYYGYVKSLESPHSIIIGPVKSFPYDQSIIKHILKKYKIEHNQKTRLFFEKIPQMNIETLLNKLILFNYSLNNQELSREDLFSEVQQDYIAKTTSIHQNEKYNKFDLTVADYYIEDIVTRYVERGDIEGIKQLTKQNQNAKVGKIANDNIRQLKNTSIILIVLVSRAAVKSGISPSVALPLAGTYIQQAEIFSDFQAIRQLTIQCLLDFTSQVKEAKVPANADFYTRKVIQYVNDHINEPLTVHDIAKQIGFSQSYLSRKFKKEAEISLSTFIRNEKLEHGKDLLRFSTKSISEISSYLCFSSQSHFQKSFKLYSGLTPKKYRDSQKK